MYQMDKQISYGIQSFVLMILSVVGVMGCATGHKTVSGQQAWDLMRSSARPVELSRDRNDTRYQVFSYSPDGHAVQTYRVKTESLSDYGRMNPLIVEEANFHDNGLNRGIVVANSLSQPVTDWTQIPEPQIPTEMGQLSANQTESYLRGYYRGFATRHNERWPAQRLDMSQAPYSAPPHRPSGLPQWLRLWG